MASLQSDSSPEIERLVKGFGGERCCARSVRPIVGHLPHQCFFCNRNVPPQMKRLATFFHL
jgi:hypothetical protein